MATMLYRLGRFSFRRRCRAGHVPGLTDRDPEADSDPAKPTGGVRWVTAIVRRPVVALLAAVLALGVIGRDPEPALTRS